METEHDDGKPWGYIDAEGIWIELPKTPMLLANLGPPPFDVTLPHTGEIRHIIHNPNDEQIDGSASS